MKIGLLSDIHGNILALEKILEIFQKNSVEQILCGGDMIGLGPHSEEVVKRISSLNHIICVKGNHEGYLIDGMPEIIHARPIREIEVKHHMWIHENLSEESKKFIRSLEQEIYYKVNGVTIYMTHYPFLSNGSYKTFAKVASEQELVNLFQGIEADVYLYGHTHVVNVHKINGKNYINMGSLGCPIKEEYLYAEIMEVLDGHVSIEALKIPYDAQSVRNEIQNMAYPFHEEILRVFY